MISTKLPIVGLQPLADYLLILPDTGEQKRDSGLIIPECASQKHQAKTGTVRAVGPGWTAEKTGVKVPLMLEVGQRVVYLHFAGHEIEVEGVKHRLVKEEDCFAVIE